jgi:hypothetical protein
MRVKYCLYLEKETTMERNKLLYGRIILKSILGKWILETRKQHSACNSISELFLCIVLVCEFPKQVGIFE